MISFVIYSLFRWRIKQIKQGLPIEQQSTFELKLLAGKYLQQRSSFFDISIYQQWKGDYLALVNYSWIFFV
jgi:hypothetical protein